MSLIDDFLWHLRFERGLSPKTIVAYESDLKQLDAFMDARSIGGCVQEDLVAFLAERQEEGDGARSRARKLSAIRTFCRWQVDRGLREDDPSDRLEGPKIGKALPDVLKQEEVERLLAAPDVNRPEGMRDRAMLETAYACGLRVTELISIKATDLDEDRAVLRVSGKGSRQRLVPVGEEALHWIDLYRSSARGELLRSAKQIKAAGRSALFVTRRGGPMTRQAFWKSLKKYALIAGLPPDLHPHTLRHCFASHLLAAGADLRIVQALLGHADITTTEIYTHVELSHLRKEYLRHHPRG